MLPQSLLRFYTIGKTILRTLKMLKMLTNVQPRQLFDQMPTIYPVQDLSLLNFDDFDECKNMRSVRTGRLH